MAKFKIGKFKLKEKTKSIIKTVAVVLGIAMILGLVVGFLGNDRKTISSTEFKRGDLDANGQFVESDVAIYTKDAFSCDGLRIEPAFESNLTYDVYYYDVNGTLLASKTNLEGLFEEDFPMADRARVVIHPEKPADVKASDWTIRFWEIIGRLKAKGAQGILVLPIEKMIY